MTLVVRAIVANALTSRAADWSNSIGPVQGCTLAANGNQVTIDSVIPSGESIAVTAGSFNTGVYYRIVSQGTTIWTGIGAGSNNLGVVFQASGAGSGTGQAVAITTITTAVAGTAVAGGGFTLSAAVAFSADVRAGTTTCLTVSGSNSYAMSGARVIGGSAAGALGINHTGSGVILAAAGCVFNGGNGSAAHGATVNGVGAILRLDAAIEVRGSTVGTSQFGVNLLVGAVEVQNNSVINGSASGAPGIQGAAGTTITINNTTVNGSAASATGVGIATSGNLSGANCVLNASGNEAVSVSGNGVMNLVSSQANASTASPAITAQSATATHTFSGVVNNRPSPGNSYNALNVRRLRLGVGVPHQQIFDASDGTALILYSPEAGIFNNPSPANVREGTVFGPGGALVGTFAQTVSPSLEQIGAGVWGAAARTLTEKTGFELTSTERNAILSLIESPGGMLAGKLSATAYTAPPSADFIAEKVQQGILNENDGSAILNAIVGAIGNQNIDQVALVAAIRADLERGAGKLAACSTLTALEVWSAANRTLSAGAAVEIGSTSVTAISTQLERTGGPLSLKLDAASYIAPANASILAIKTATDLLNTARLSNVPTEDFLLQVISQWLSAPS
jgi:hypothetical protein